MEERLRTAITDRLLSEDGPGDDFVLNLVDAACDGDSSTRPPPRPPAAWSRAAALLARQALEQAVTDRLARRHPIPPDTHHTGYELPPTHAALRGWVAAVAEVVRAVG